MRIAVIGGGASGMATAYLLDKQGYHVTVFERQPMLGGHIRTLNKNVKPNQSECNEVLESGPLEFPTAFHNFVALMQELDVKLVPVDIGSELFPKNGGHFLSEVAIQKNFTGIQRLIEYLRFDSIYVRSAGLWLKTRFADMKDFYDQPLSRYLKNDSTGSLWLKLLTMYSYSTPFDQIDNFPAELAIPMLRDYLAVNWLRVEGGVYSYIEKILERFRGKVWLNVEIANISRSSDSVKIERSNGETQEFDKVVFATPPDQVIALLADPTDAEIKRFSAWKANYATTIVHTDTSMYDKQGIRYPTEFDFFQTDTRWGYNGCLNQLCGIPSSPQHHFLSFQLEEIIAKDRIIHIQQHHTPLYTTESFRYRDEVVATNGENHTYHVGAYLGDGLHEGAITSAFRVAELIG
ncbi:amine oxidase (plasmid) [Leptolyngbya boryana NIES-2135]|jgi:predicted NAD/FAD-binding protein|uniref:Amine oxidase n=1 Tax=Leptolyngbya boryana NIES-2135 TaxID=1973484 RepID=A0A1Z4JRP1_LEPBY|nr:MULTISPECIES: FAD-dependent oxidoreductase [Leptolyngbya]BAY59421.1 amine oxidase [Leptolyngbya boryana NIES-2135]MBD2373006.1 FAD-dependent oxidoreductase [Leptolyngbya sp. FACHB-238]MBD2397241.1 FAD-dependent oxidoreductase [Leptolyngbya sp. FACHB-239]MBD2403953.1 FAD-dependent oxidoreductase [Leptolyngbya sp. FACHB-402]ULP33251.1 FAD-dependent oxidoreductase [Leptolyngbya boryana IU 594]